MGLERSERTCRHVRGVGAQPGSLQLLTLRVRHQIVSSEGYKALKVNTSCSAGTYSRSPKDERTRRLNVMWFQLIEHMDTNKNGGTLELVHSHAGCRAMASEASQETAQVHR